MKNPHPCNYFKVQQKKIQSCERKHSLYHSETCWYKCCERIKAQFSDPLWMWSVSQTDCHTVSLTVSRGRFFKLPPGHPAISNASQRAFSLAFDSLLSFSLDVSVFFLLFHAEHLGCWKGVLDESTFIQCKGRRYAEKRRQDKERRDGGERKGKERRWKQINQEWRSWRWRERK